MFVIEDIKCRIGGHGDSGALFVLLIPLVVAEVLYEQKTASYKFYSNKLPYFNWKQDYHDVCVWKGGRSFSYRRRNLPHVADKHKKCSFEVVHKQNAFYRQIVEMNYGKKYGKKYSCIFFSDVNSIVEFLKQVPKKHSDILSRSYIVVRNNTFSEYVEGEFSEYGHYEIVENARDPNNDTEEFEHSFVYQFDRFNTIDQIDYICDAANNLVEGTKAERIYLSETFVASSNSISTVCDTFGVELPMRRLLWRNFNMSVEKFSEIFQ